MHIVRTPPPADGLSGRTHCVRFYDGDNHTPLLDEVAEFLDRALRSGGTAIVIATGDHLRALQRRLDGLGISPRGEPWHSGLLIALDAQETLDRFMVEGWPDEQRFDDSVGTLVRDACAAASMVHAFGEMVALLCAQGHYDAALRLEQLWNNLQAGRTFSLFCAYPWATFASPDIAARFQQICLEHDHVRPDAGAHPPLPADGAARRLAALEQQNRALQDEVRHLRDAEQTLRHRETELLDFVDNAAEGLHRVGRDGTILWANKAELAMLGYHWEEYVGHHIAEFHADRAAIDGILHRLLAGETLYDQPARLRCKDGSIKPVLIHTNGCFVGGVLSYTRCFTRDASDRVRLEEAHRARQALLAELTAMNAAKDEFLAMLAHELRNPLAPISAAAELLALRPDAPERVAQGAAIIQRQARHLTALLDDLLDVARVTRGLIPLAREPVDLRCVLATAAEQTAPLVRQHGHRYSAVLPPEPVTVLGDHKRLVQVAANMLTNAAKYTPDGGTIEARVAVRDGQAELAISDNGAGLAPDLLAKVFQLFVQGRRAAHRPQGGLGVGLALVKSLVEAHGGTATAHSDGAGCGSTFRVRLPLVPAGARTSPASADRRAGAELAPGGPVRGLRILVVDDNVDAATTMEMLLAATGHEVALAHSAAAALELALLHAPDVCLLDIGLPDLDGRTLARRLRALPALRGSLLVAVSGYGQPSDRAASLAAGFDHHLVKPVDPAGLLALLQQGRH